MNRRSFVRNAALASAAMAGTDALAFAPSRKKIGLQLYSVRDEMKSGLEAVLTRLAGVGYQQIEMYNYNNGMYWDKDMKSVAALLKRLNLTSPSAHITLPDFLYKGNDDAMKKAIEDGKIIGNKYIAVPYLEEQHRKPIDKYKQLAGRLNRAGELCKEGGIKFAYHNHAFEFDAQDGTTGYDILLKETDPALVKMELDLYWVKNAGLNPIDLFKANPGRFTMWHVKDMDKANKNKQTEVGSGSIDYKEIFQYQKLSGLEYFYVEQENYTINPYDSIEKCFKYVKENLV